MGSLVDAGFGPVANAFRFSYDNAKGPGFYKNGDQIGVKGALKLDGDIGSVDTAALLHGAGTSTTPLSNGTTAGKNFMGYWVRSNATTGDTRGIYVRLYIGAAGSGEAARFYTTIDGANAGTGGTVNGAHVSLNVTGSGTISGQGNALRCTLDVAQDLTPGGTLAVVTIDSNLASGVTMPTNKSFIRFADLGATKLGNLFEIPNAADGTMFAAHTTQTMSHSIKIISADGTAYYIMCTNAATNRS